MAATKRVDTATLIRGDTYVVRHPDHTPAAPRDSLYFKYGIPVPIHEKHILALLENLFDEIEDGDGEVYEKPRFLIERGVAMPEPGQEKKPTRLASNRTVKKRTPRRRAG